MSLTEKPKKYMQGKKRAGGAFGASSSSSPSTSSSPLTLSSPTSNKRLSDQYGPQMRCVETTVNKEIAYDYIAHALTRQPEYAKDKHALVEVFLDTLNSKSHDKPASITVQLNQHKRQAESKYQQLKAAKSGTDLQIKKIAAKIGKTNLLTPKTSCGE